jgi:hypothetical protein
MTVPAASRSGLARPELLAQPRQPGKGVSAFNSPGKGAETASMSILSRGAASGAGRFDNIQELYTFASRW